MKFVFDKNKSSPSNAIPEDLPPKFDSNRQLFTVTDVLNSLSSKPYNKEKAPPPKSLLFVLFMNLTSSKMIVSC